MYRLRQLAVKGLILMCAILLILQRFIEVINIRRYYLIMLLVLILLVCSVARLNCESFIRIDLFLVVCVWHPAFPLNRIKKYLIWHRIPSHTSSQHVTAIQWTPQFKAPSVENKKLSGFIFKARFRSDCSFACFSYCQGVCFTIAAFSVLSAEILFTKSL